MKNSEDRKTVLNRSVKTYNSFAKIFLGALISANNDGNNMSILKKTLVTAKSGLSLTPRNPDAKSGLGGMNRSANFVSR